jgi:nicotinamidase-related amidase
MADVLLLVDALSDFSHEDGDRLLASFRSRADGFVDAVTSARRASIPIVYANEDGGRWDGDGGAVVARALDGPAAGVIARIRPGPEDALILKPRYSAFIGTPLELLLRELRADRIVLGGTATEMCVAQTAISARELGFKVTVVRGACASVREEDEQLALEYLERIAGCRIAQAIADVSFSAPCGSPG